MAIDLLNTTIHTWFERDRAHVRLDHKDGPTIIEWWDGAVAEAVRDGFLKPTDWHSTALATARQLGLLEPGAQPLKIAETPRGWVAATADLGVYCGWKRGGAAVWSSELDPEGVERGAYVFGSEEEARELFEQDGIEDGIFAEVNVKITLPTYREPTRASFDACMAEGLEPMLPLPAPTIGH
jgi:hypothetical protein